MRAARATGSSPRTDSAHPEEQLLPPEVALPPIDKGQTVGRITPLEVSVNGAPVTVIHVGVKPLHAARIELEFHTSRTTFQLDATIDARRFDGSHHSLTIPGFDCKDEGASLTKHLRNPEPVGDQLNLLVQEIELPRLPKEVEQLHLRLILPSKTRLRTIRNTQVATSKGFGDSYGWGAAEEHQLPELDFLIYTTAAAFADDLLPLRSHYISRGLARAGFKVGFVPSSKCEMISEVVPNLIQIPFHDLPQLLPKIARQRRRGVLLLSSKPDVHSIRLLESLALSGWKTLYEVRDDMEAMSQKGMSQYYSLEFERYIARRAAKVVCVSDPLKWKMEALGVASANVLTSSNGVDDGLLNDFLLDAREILLEPKDARIVYFGHMFTQRFDLDLVNQLARRLPAHKIELFGIGADPKAFEENENVVLRGFTTIDEFLRQARGASVGIMPFKDDRLTFSLSPLKYPQYLAAGLKVVTTDVHQLRGKPLCFSEQEHFEDNVRAALEYQITTQDVSEVTAYLESHRWNGVVDTYSKFHRELSGAEG